jgi:hypothetical protein
MENNESMNLPHALDTLKRADYASDAAYLEAAADLELKRSSPEFQKALQRTRAEYMQREFKRVEKENAALLDEEIKRTRLSESEDRAILERAQGEVANAIRAGQLDPANMQAEIDKRSAAYSKQEIRRKATGTLVNAAMRQATGRVVVKDK